MIIKKPYVVKDELTFEGDKFKILRTELIPDGFSKSLEIMRAEKGLKYVDQEKEWHLAARIPKVIFDRLWRDFPDEMREPGSKWLYKWLDTDEGKVYKTFAGKLS